MTNTSLKAKEDEKTSLICPWYPFSSSFFSLCLSVSLFLFSPSFLSFLWQEQRAWEPVFPLCIRKVALSNAAIVSSSFFTTPPTSLFFSLPPPSSLSRYPFLPVFLSYAYFLILFHFFLNQQDTKRDHHDSYLPNIPECTLRRKCFAKHNQHPLNTLRYYFLLFSALLFSSLLFSHSFDKHYHFFSIFTYNKDNSISLLFSLLALCILIFLIGNTGTCTSNRSDSGLPISFSRNVNDATYQSVVWLVSQVCIVLDVLQREERWRRNTRPRGERKRMKGQKGVGEVRGSGAEWAVLIISCRESTQDLHSPACVLSGDWPR